MSEVVIYSIPDPYQSAGRVEVYGDPDMASYEWRVIHPSGLSFLRSYDAGYGIAEVALRDALNAATQYDASTSV